MSDKISRIQLQVIEKSLDKLFAKLGIDVEFSGHFLDRINDERNIKQITISELINIYHSLYDKFGIKISKTPEEIEEVIKSLSTDINIPVNIHFDRKSSKIEMAAKTIMRKKNFKTPNPILHVESFKEFIARQLQEETGSEMGTRILTDMDKEYDAMKKKHPIHLDSSAEVAEYKSNLLKYFTKSYGKEHKKDIEKVLNTEIERLGGNTETGPKNLRGATNMRILRSLVKLNIIKSS